MKIFEHQGKKNFVDDNNVFVGWDNSEGCCEAFDDWFVNSTGALLFLKQEDLDGYNFDVTYCMEYSNKNCVNDVDELVKFRLVKMGAPTVFLVLNNSHNGYYSHGFSLERGQPCSHIDHCDCYLKRDVIYQGNL